MKKRYDHLTYMLVDARIERLQAAAAALNPRRDYEAWNRLVEDIRATVRKVSDDHNGDD